MLEILSLEVQLHIIGGVQSVIQFDKHLLLGMAQEILTAQVIILGDIDLELLGKFWDDCEINVRYDSWGELSSRCIEVRLSPISSIHLCYSFAHIRREEVRLVLLEEGLNTECVD